MKELLRVVYKNGKVIFEKTGIWTCKDPVALFEEETGHVLVSDEGSADVFFQTISGFGFTASDIAKFQSGYANSSCVWGFGEYEMFTAPLRIMSVKTHNYSKFLSLDKDTTTLSIKDGVLNLELKPEYSKTSVTREWLQELTNYAPLYLEAEGVIKFGRRGEGFPDVMKFEHVVSAFNGDVIIDVEHRRVFMKKSAEQSLMKFLDSKVEPSHFTLKEIVTLFGGKPLHKQWWGFGQITPDNTAITKKDNKIQIRMKTADAMEQVQFLDKVLCLKLDQEKRLVRFGARLPKEGLTEIDEGRLWFHEKTKMFYGINAEAFDYAICDKELADAMDVFLVLHGLDSENLAWLLSGPETKLITKNESRKQNPLFVAPVNSRTTKVSLHQRTFKLEYIEVQNTEDEGVDIEKLIESPLDFFKFVASEGESVIPKQIFDMLERVEKGFKADQIATICSGKGKSLLKKYDFMQQLKSGVIKAVLKYNGSKLVEAKVVDIATTPIDRIHEITGICSADEYVKGHLYYIK